MYQVHTIKRLPGNSLNIARKWTGYFLTQKIHYSPKDNQRNTMIALHGLDSSMVYPEYSTIEKTPTMAAGAAVAQSTSPVGEGSSPTFKHRRGGEKKGGCEISSSQALSSDTTSRKSQTRYN